MKTLALSGLLGINLFNDVNVFLILMVLVGGILGLISRSVSMAAFGAYLTFIYIAVNTDLFIYTSILYVSLAAMLVVMGMQLVTFATESGGEQPA